LLCKLIVSTTTTTINMNDSRIVFFWV